MLYATRLEEEHSHSPKHDLTGRIRRIGEIYELDILRKKISRNGTAGLSAETWSYHGPVTDIAKLAERVNLNGDLPDDRDSLVSKIRRSRRPITFEADTQSFLDRRKEELQVKYDPRSENYNPGPRDVQRIDYIPVRGYMLRDEKGRFVKKTPQEYTKRLVELREETAEAKRKSA